MHVTTIIYTPLMEEYESLQVRFKPEKDINGDSYTGYLSKGKGRESVLVVVGFEWGNDAAYRVLQEVFRSHTCDLAVCVGIAGAISKDAKLGDVFYSRQVLDLTQRMKQEKVKGVTRIKYDPEPYSSSEEVAKSLDRSRLSATGVSPYIAWKKACALVNEGRLVGINTQALGHPTSYFFAPEGTSGKIASTNMVLADSQAVEDVRECGRKMACVDTESAGFARACCEVANIPHIVVRGISDTADEQKKIAEKDFKNVFRSIAASNAALFLQHNLTRMLASIKKNATQCEAVETIDPQGSAIGANEQFIRGELTRRSVVFKTLENEQKMPVPRLRKIGILSEAESNKRPPEMEIEQVLSENERILVQLPNHYPDAALPWLFGHLLTEASIHGKYTIPVYVKWSEFGPPRNNLDAQLESKGLAFSKNSKAYHIVFIILDARLGSKTKAQFLSQECVGYENATVLLFPDRNETNVVENEIEQHFSPEVFQVEGISFASIARYVQSSFGMPIDEAEMVATRLMSTFRNYRLKVHPTFLASIQKDTVLSFIDANQRGELIELAVAGLLSLLVADDPSKVVLRRGTRERFLAQLAVQIYSERINYDELALEKYVEDYAAEMGFDIIPSQFIKGFVDNGIIAFEAGRAEIAVPVIRTYMLAKGLVGNGTSGIKHFDLDQSVFDFATFDLFSEFNSDKFLYAAVSRKLDASIDFFTEKVAKYNTKIEDGKYRSKLLSRTLDFSKMSEDITRSAEQLVEMTSLVSEKQAKMDVQNEIARSSTAKSIDISDPDSYQDEHVAITRFLAAVVMLGAAAEKMIDTDKVEIIKKVLKLVALISTDLLTIYSSFDAESAVEEAIASIKESGAITFDDEDAESQFRTYVEMVTAEWEFNMAAHPIHTILGVLCETGRSNVLLSPLSRSNTETNLEEFFRVSWAFDMDPVGKSNLPRELSKAIGSSPFLRMVFGISTVNRIYWFHHGKTKKEALLKGVNELFKPLSIKSDIDPIDLKSEG
jgi:nucleoside phosphorylase